jgi:protein-L-isoaspartate(D-aspartate) O-methyltransferase
MTTSPTLDFATARQIMVDGQIRPNRVSDPRILNAMRSLPRERFLPPHLAHLAYVDEDVPLANGRALMEPMVIARLVTLAAPLEGERALVVGAGTGYGAALLASCGVKVFALEEEAGLRAIARDALMRTGLDITLVEGPLAQGWASAAPYDLILIEGAVRDIPPTIAAQVKPQGGRLVGVLSMDGTGRQAVLAEPSLGGLRCQAEFDCATPFIPSLLPKPAFTF